MGLGILLTHFSLKGESFLKKALFPIIGFISYLFNFTINAIVWGFIVSLITIMIMTNASHPILYFTISAVFSFLIVAPSGETDIYTGFQSLFVYFFFTSGNYLDFLEVLGKSPPKFINLIFSSSPFIFLGALLVGSIISIRGIFKLMKQDTLTRETLKLGPKLFGSD